MTKGELKERWETILDQLYSDIERIKVDNFFRPLTPVKISESKNIIYLITAGANSSFYQNMINNYKKSLDKACEKVMGKVYTMEVVDNEPTEDSDEPVPEDSSYGFNPRYTFDTFVSGPNNQLALAACLAIADKGYAKEYNPLFIYSGPGLGKTHLMHAVGQYVKKNFPKKKVMYVSSEAFTNELIKAIREKSQEAFRNKYRKVDLLLFDDVQFISGKESTQEEVFHTFETLYNSRKQIIFTSDKPPKDLEGIPERLQSRFSWGLPAEIQPPGYETRVAILNNIATLSGVEVTPVVSEVLEVIAQNVTSNIREIEGAFNRVNAMSKLTNTEISKDLAKRVLTDIFDTPKTKEITPENIKKAVAKYYGIKVADMESGNRSRNIGYPRQIAIYIIRENTNYSLPQIGKLFGGRDHTTIRHSYEKMCEEIKTDKDLRSAVENILATLEE
ncbi:MAG: chromosomal replication initiator protein DnaA [Clostridia bacterium]|nr:chromosomal replication initiator protein DnaA [Clostridia bacterium]